MEDMKIELKKNPKQLMANSFKTVKGEVDKWKQEVRYLIDHYFNLILLR